MLSADGTGGGEGAAKASEGEAPLRGSGIGAGVGPASSPNSSDEIGGGRGGSTFSERRASPELAVAVRVSSKPFQHDERDHTEDGSAPESPQHDKHLPVTLEFCCCVILKTGYARMGAR